MSARPAVILQRAEGWEGRLSDAVEDWRVRPFVWGWSDCLGFARDVCREVGGADPFPPLSYRSERGAMRAGRRAGFESYEGFIGAHLPRAGRARRGDLVLIAAPGPWRGGLGVRLARRSACLGPGGMIFVGHDQEVAAWSIG